MLIFPVRFSKMKNINYRWCTKSDARLLEEVAELFIRNTGEQYISHGEVIDGRANNMNEWKPDIREIMSEEFSNAMYSDFDCQDTFTRLVIASSPLASGDGQGIRKEEEAGAQSSQNTIIALALIEFRPDTDVTILCDIVVDAQYRGQKIGETMLNWIQCELKNWGAKFMFLESGKNNRSAHDFFERSGFGEVSVVMAKEI